MSCPLSVIQFSSPLFVTALVLFTVLWTIGAWQLIRFWQHNTTFFDVPDTRAYMRARTRCFPTFMAAGFAMLVVGWILAFESPNHGYGSALFIVVFGAVAVFLSSLIVGPVVLLFNRPRWLVPPHLRGDPGYLEVRRRGRRTGSTARR